MVKALNSPGWPIDPPARRFMELGFGQDFSQVRLHTDPIAAESAGSLRANAYTVGSHIIFASGGYQPASSEGRRLLAHELAHVVQEPMAESTSRNHSMCAGGVRADDISSPGQPSELEAERAAAMVVDGPTAGTPPVIQARRPPVARAAAAPAPATASLLLEEEAAGATPAQMPRGEFLELLHDTLCRTVEAGFVGSQYEGRGCPLVERAMNFYRRQSAASIEASIHRYASEARTATSARDYLDIVGTRVGAVVKSFVATGRVTGIPPELEPLMVSPLQGTDGIEGLLARAASGIARGIVDVAGAIGGALSSVGRAFRALFKHRSEAAGPSIDPHSVRAQLGRGLELQANVRSRMERAYGQDFSRVRVHTDRRAGDLAEGLGARALTVGSDVAFAPGEYRPGTVAGDALIAHELAHTIQQQAPATQTTAVPELEQEADESAAGAVASLWGDQPEATTKRVRGRTGLRLQRCASSPAARTTRTVQAPAQCAVIDPVQWRRDVLAARDEKLSPHEKGERMLSLVQQALCQFGRTVIMARESSSEFADPADYVPVEQGVNFDTRLNDKRRYWSEAARKRNPDKRPPKLTDNGGYYFSSEGKLYYVLGPIILQPAGPDHTRFIYEHELYHVEHHATKEHRRQEVAALRGLTSEEKEKVTAQENADDEVEAYLAGFPKYFPLLGSVGKMPDGTTGYAGEQWPELVKQFDLAGSTKQDQAVRLLEKYYKGADDQHRNLFIEWLRSTYRKNHDSGLVRRVAGELKVDVTVPAQRWK